MSNEDFVRRAYETAEEKDIPAWIACFNPDGVFIDESVGLTYREESVHLVLSGALRIFGPGAGIGETDFRLPITIAVESTFDANPDAHVGKSSRASADWFLTHRTEIDRAVRMCGFTFCALDLGGFGSGRLTELLTVRARS